MFIGHGPERRDTGIVVVLDCPPSSQGVTGTGRGTYWGEACPAPRRTAASYSRITSLSFFSFSLFARGAS